jgi:hypothetical protein
MNGHDRESPSLKCAQRVLLRELRGRFPIVRCSLSSTNSPPADSTFAVVLARPKQVLCRGGRTDGCAG